MSLILPSQAAIGSSRVTVPAAGAGIELVTSDYGNGNVAASQAQTGAMDTSTADFMVAAVVDYDAYPGAAVYDNKGNTWIALTLWEFYVYRIQLFYCIPATVGAGHVVYSGGVYNYYSSMGVMAFKGVNQSSPFDVENGELANNVLSANSGSITTTNPNALVVTGYSLQDATVSSSVAGFNQEVDLPGSSVGSDVFMGLGLGWAIKAAPGAINPAWSFTSVNAAIGATASFNPA